MSRARFANVMAVTIVLVLALAGCAAPTTGEVAAGALDEAGVEVGSTWQLVSGQVGGEDLRLLPDRPITFSRTETGVEGQSSCNTYAEQGLEGETPDERVFPGLANTEMGCALPGEESLDNPIMDLEEAFLGALYDTTEVEVDDDEMRLTGPDSALVFEPSDPGEVDAPADADASGTDAMPDPTNPSVASVRDPLATAGTWVLEAGTVDEVALDVVAGGRVDLVADDGQAGGRAACNDYGVTYLVDDDVVDVQVTSVTEMGCPGARMELEATYLDALERVTTVERTESRLTLSGDGVKLTFVEEAPLVADGLIGIRWELEVVARGTTTTAAAGDGFLLLAEDGTWTGSTGCRALSGNWSRNGSSLVFPSWGAEGECPADLSDQDRAVTRVLESPLATLDGDRLTLEAPDAGDDDNVLPALVYRATPVAAQTPTPGTGSAPTIEPTVDPTTDPTRDAGDVDTSIDALFAGTVFLWRTGGITGLDDSVTIRGDGLISVTSEDVGSDHRIDRGRLESVAAGLDAFDWDDLARRAEAETTADDAITWHVQRFDRVLVISDIQLPDPPPALLVEAAALMDEFAPNA